MTKPNSVKKTYRLKASAVAALEALKAADGGNETQIVENAIIHLAAAKKVKVATPYTQN